MTDFRKIEYLTFDCYGTLIDWESGITAALRPLLQHNELDLSDEDVLNLYAELESSVESDEFIPYKGVPREVVKKVGIKYGFFPDDKEINSLINSIGFWKPFDDTIDSLQALGKKYRLVVVSNVDDDLFEITQSKLRVEFDDVITAEQIGAYKTEHRVFETVLARLAVPKTNILHVAQSLYHDIAPANSMGIGTVRVNRRHGKSGSGATPEASAIPDFEVPDLRSLVELLEISK